MTEDPITNALNSIKSKKKPQQTIVLSAITVGGCKEMCVPLRRVKEKKKPSL